MTNVGEVGSTTEKLEVFTAAPKEGRTPRDAAFIEIHEKFGPISIVTPRFYNAYDPREKAVRKALNDSTQAVYRAWDDTGLGVVIAVAPDDGRYAVAWPKGSNFKPRARRVLPPRVPSVPTDLLARVHDMAERLGRTDDQVIRDAIESFLGGQS